MNTRGNRKSIWIALAAFSIYFGGLLIPKIYPAFGASQWAFIQRLSLLLVVPVVLLLTAWSLGAIVISRLRNRPLSSAARVIGHVALVAVLCLAGFLGASYAISGPLPSGSHLATFDRSVWFDQTSAEYVDGDITPRQKMLGHVVTTLPGHNRHELEQMLGPSLETSYFQNSGRDLIYVTGPQRDAFLAIDSEWLLIWLDDAGTFERYAIVND